MDWSLKGYVPRSERMSTPLAPRSLKSGTKANDTKTSSGKHILIHEMDFMSTIITNDEYCVSKMPVCSTETSVDVELREPKGNLSTENAEHQLSVSGKSSTSTVNDSQRKSMQRKGESSKAVKRDDFGVQVLSSTSITSQSDSRASTSEAEDRSQAENKVSEAGIIVLPPPEVVVEGETSVDIEESEPEQAPLKWPRKPEVPNFDYFDYEDSWFDAPPEGFSLTLSPFATMWNSIFTWTTSYTLAFIYGRDESCHEEYILVNGMEYPRKKVLGDGRSTEIKDTLAGSLARALPRVVADLRLPIPISILEQGMGWMLDTMSFVDALPAFRMKQWRVIVLLFIEAVSVCRLPALTPYMTERRILFHKVVDGSQIGAEEYRIMKDLMIPLGRAPDFSAQSGA